MSDTPLSKALAELAGFPEAYSLAPLLSMNDDFREDEMVRQLDELKAKNVTRFMLFPMPGLNVPYPSKAYFDWSRFIVREAKKRDMKVWFYDEYCWPSGVAGGLLNEKYPECLQPSCRLYLYPVSADGPREVDLRLPDGHVIQVLARRKRDGATVSLMGRVGDTSLRWKAPEGEWEIFLFRIKRSSDLVLDCCTVSRWTNGLPGFVDVMNKEAMAKYIELVYEEYYRAMPEEFGQTVKGFFFDEPSMTLFDAPRFKTGRNALSVPIDGKGAFLREAHQESLKFRDDPELYGLRASIPWTRDLLAIFKERRGYDLRPKLLKLVDGDRKTTCDFHSLLSDLYAESYAEQLGAWCEKHNVTLTGHWSEYANDGDHYRQLRPIQAPGIDLLGNHAAVNQLIFLPRRAVSTARLFKRERAMTECFALLPWNVGLGERLAVSNLLNGLGVNLLVPIDYAYSLRGFRKYTNNPPDFYQSPSWKYQRQYSDHVARLSRAVSLGRSTVGVAVFYGAEERVARSGLTEMGHCADLDRPERDAVRRLYENQIEPDIVFDTAIKEDMTVKKGRLVGGDAAYGAIVMPSVRIVSEKVLKTLTRFVKSGGRLVLLSHAPTVAPDGKSLAGAWEKLFGFVPSEDIRENETRTFGSGTLFLLADPSRVVEWSAPVLSGEPKDMFDETERYFCLYNVYPQWLTFDLGEELELVSLSWRPEDMKKHIVYEYDIARSAGGETWETLFSGKGDGVLHRADFPRGTRASRLRLDVASGGGRMLGIVNLSIAYRDASGAVKIWKPKGLEPDALGEILADARADIVFFDGRDVSGNLVVGQRRLADGSVIVAAVNNSTAERHLEGATGAERELGVLELETGNISAAPTVSGRFPVSFGPFEAKVFVLPAAKQGFSRVASLDRRRREVARLDGPWPFRTERPNAFPMIAGEAKMADPAYPDQWRELENGAIPAAFGKVPYVLFKSAFRVDHLDGGARLLFERDLFLELTLNGRRIDAAPTVDRYFDGSGLSVPVGDLLRKGENEFRCVYVPEIHERYGTGPSYNAETLKAVPDIFLSGNFSTRDKRIEAPTERLSGEPWETQGYPYYSGSGVYSLAIPEGVEKRGLWLEADAVGAVELRADGRTLGARLSPSYLFDLSNVKNEKLELLVTNGAGNLFSARGAMGLAGGKTVFASGLRSARLVKFQNETEKTDGAIR